MKNNPWGDAYSRMDMAEACAMGAFFATLILVLLGAV